VKILITGALGNLGLMCMEQALVEGHSLCCFDMDTAANRSFAAKYAENKKINFVFGDIRDSKLLEYLMAGVDGVLHNASLLPPLTETQTELANQINVRATENLIAIVEKQKKKPVLIFPSSVTVFGLPDGEHSIKNVQDKTIATDHYTRQKITIEKRLQASSIPWVILRVGVSVDTRTLKTDKETFKKLLDVHPDNPMEYVHPRDVAMAMCQALVKEDARNKVLLIGGGRNCQITQRQFLSCAFDALGLKLPLSAHGESFFYTHWMDTEVSQTILQFQRFGFSDYQQEMRDKLRVASFFVWPLRWVLNPLLAVLLRQK